MNIRMFRVGILSDDMLSNMYGRRFYTCYCAQLDGGVPPLSKTESIFERLEGKSYGSGPLYHAKAQGTPGRYAYALANGYSLFLGDCYGVYNGYHMRVVCDGTTSLVSQAYDGPSLQVTRVSLGEDGKAHWYITRPLGTPTYRNWPGAATAAQATTLEEVAHIWGCEAYWSEALSTRLDVYNAIRLDTLVKGGEPLFQDKLGIMSAAFIWRYAGVLPDWMNAGFTRCSLAIAEQVPKLSSNSFANVKELASLFTSLITGGWKDAIRHAANKKLRRRIADNWLSYRYAYNTTKADLEELTALATRLANLPAGQVRFSQTYTAPNGVSFRLSCDLPASAFIPTSIVEASKTFNLRLTGYNVWDMIPFSFIVDWLIPIGDWLAAAQNMSDMAEMSPTNVWGTVSCNTTHDDGTKEEHYLRIPMGSLPHTVSGYLTYLTDPVSGKTITMRVADTIALFIL